ncbi:MAG: hypothetical protein MOP51_2415, partial [Citricoccus sp.]|nr:hypothetical protein [Citricoccus sp. WCRC_4]
MSGVLPTGAGAAVSGPSSAAAGSRPGSQTESAAARASAVLGR